MSKEEGVKKPFSELGEKLKLYRERRKRSLAEASGAVEIEAASLESIEKGERRPDEEILSLLISYFEIEEEYASKLYRLAGYNDSLVGSVDQAAFDISQPIAMLMPVDLRIVYTDTYFAIYISPKRTFWSFITNTVCIFFVGSFKKHCLACRFNTHPHFVVFD